MHTVIDTDTLDLLRTTARGVLGDSPSRGTMAELGWLGLLTPPEHGGSGWNVVEACILAEESGRALSPVNWSGPALAAAALASSVSTSSLATAIVAGESQGLFVTGGLKDDGGFVRPSEDWVLGAL